MGVAYGGLCYVDAAAARAAHCQLAYPVGMIEGGAPTNYACTGVDNTAGTLAIQKTEGAASAPSTFALTTSYAACDETQLSMAILTPELAGASFMVGLSGVLICYLVAFASGQVLDSIRGR